MTGALDPRLNAFRADLADIRLRGAVAAPRHVEGRPGRNVVGRAAVHRSPEPGAPLDTGGFAPFGCLSVETPRSRDIVAAAERYLGCPYLWGGKSFLGIDCSGLVQNAFRDIGIAVLRDTDMQRDTVGTAVPVQGE